MTENIEVHALTHPGALRPENEDTIAVGGWIAANALDKPKRFDWLADNPLLAVVADGMGGHAGGALASRTAVQHLQSRAEEIGSAEAARRALVSANAALYDMMSGGDAPGGMGTTVALLALTPALAVAANVGDSKIYRFDRADLVQLSTDDTPGPKLPNGRTAQITTPMMTQSLGGQKQFTGIEPHAGEEAPAPGSQYLLCSDGLSDLVGPDAIQARLAAQDGGAAVEALFRDAMAAGGRDNISIVLLRLPPGGAAGP